jgi:hypothetical protein
MSHTQKRLITGLALATASAFLLAGEAGSQAPQQGAAPAQFMSQSLGVVVFPSKGQSAELQRTDESHCFTWAKNYTGFDPLAPPPVAAPPAQAAQPPPAGGLPGGGGAVRGAAIGAAGGAIGGNAAKGAAIGAAAGAVAGVARRRGAEEAAAQQQEAAQAQQAQATQQSQQALAQKKASYNKAFGTCMQGKGYNVS